MGDWMGDDASVGQSSRCKDHESYALRCAPMRAGRWRMYYGSAIVDMLREDRRTLDARCALLRTNNIPNKLKSFSEIPIGKIGASIGSNSLYISYIYKVFLSYLPYLYPPITSTFILYKLFRIIS